MAFLRPSLIITTYNKPDHLHLVLQSTLSQKLLPLEVIVADDGSRKDTKALVDDFRRKAPFPVVHVWQEDKGFRAAKIRNEAITVSQSDYIIVIDGDIILHPKFVQDHARYAHPGYFISGGRVMLPEELTERLLREDRAWIKRSDLKLKKHLKRLRAPWITPLLFNYKAKNYRYGVTANMSFWKKDIRAINGLDEEFVGYGYEDFDLMLRFMNAGIRKRYLRYSAVSCHLYHPYSRGSEESLELNRRHFEWNENNRTTACRQGLTRYQKTDEAIVTR